MNSNFLNSIGLGTIDIGYILLGMLLMNVVLLLLIIMALIHISRFKKKYQKFMLGKNAGSLEEDIITLYEDNRFMKRSIDKNREDIKELFERHESAFQKIGLVKYDAFKEMGGRLSFAVALLDGKNDGFIINSVHGSDGCYSYTKKVKDGDSQIALSNEEKVAVERAVNGNEAESI